jgi:hypothetical protein
MVRLAVLLQCLLAVCIIVGKICYECGRYHASPDAMLEAAVLRYYEPIWSPAEPSRFVDMHRVPSKQTALTQAEAARQGRGGPGTIRPAPTF